MNVTIHTPTPHLPTSVSFYETLGFSVVSGDPQGDASVILVCGSMRVEVNPNRFARAGLRLTKPSWEAEISELGSQTTIVPSGEDHLVVDPSGVWVYLTRGDAVALESTMDGEGSCLLGNFAGLSLETASLSTSVGFWRTLGFRTEVEDPAKIDEQSWIGAQSETGFGICWMRPNACPHLFFNPSFTFFNSGKNPEIIAGMRAAGIEMTEEITVFNDEGIVDNVIIRDPGGYGFFVFND